MTKLNKELKEVNDDVRWATKEPTNKVIEDLLATEENEASELEKKISDIEKARKKLKGESLDKEKILKKYNKYGDEWKKRKKAFREIVSQITEQMACKEHEFVKKLGIETDEMLGVKPSN